MDKMERVELQLLQKQEKKQRLNEEIKDLQEKIEQIKQENVLQATKAMHFGTTEYRQLSKAIRDGSVMEFLEKKYQKQEEIGKNEETAN